MLCILGTTKMTTPAWRSRVVSSLISIRLAVFHACQCRASREWTRDKSGGKQWQTTSLCALPEKRQWFIVVTKGRSRPDGTFHVMQPSTKLPSRCHRALLIQGEIINYPITVKIVIVSQWHTCTAAAARPSVVGGFWGLITDITRCFTLDFYWTQIDCSYLDNHQRVLALGGNVLGNKHFNQA